MKSFSFYKVAALVRILFVEFLLFIFAPGFGGNLARDLEENTVKKDMSYLITVLVLSLLCLAWLIWTMIKPRRQSGSGYTNVIIPYKFTGFCSTHPSYVLVDVLIMMSFAIIFTYDGPTDTFEYYRMVSAWIVALFVPVFRLFCWFILGLKFPPELAEGAWKPVMWLYVIVGPILALLIITGILA
jgi:hypothetical protein